MSFAVLSPAFRGLQFPFRDMFALTCHLNSFTGNNGRPSFDSSCRMNYSPFKSHPPDRLLTHHRIGSLVMIGPALLTGFQVS